MSIINLTKVPWLDKQIKKTGYKNVGFAVDLQSKVFLNCTCGYCGDMKDAVRMQSSNIVNYIDKIKSCMITDEDVVAESYYKGYACPECGTPIIFEASTMADESIPVKYTPEILQDDGNYLVVKVFVEGVRFKNFEIECEEEDNEELLFYDKTKKKFFVILLEEKILSDLLAGNNILPAGISGYEKGKLITDDTVIGSITTMQMSNFDMSCCDCLSKAMMQACGIQDIVDLFNNASGVNVKAYPENGFEGALIDLFVAINIRYYNDQRICNVASFDYTKIPKWMRLNTSWLGNLNTEYTQLVNAGVNLEAETIEEAFGMPFEKLCQSYDLSSYANNKKAYQSIEALHLSENAIKTLSKIAFTDWHALFEITKSYDEDFFAVLYCIANSHGITPACAINIALNAARKFDKKTARLIVDFSEPLNKGTELKFQFYEQKLLSLEQFDELVKKPTLDNFCKQVLRNTNS